MSPTIPKFRSGIENKYLTTLGKYVRQWRKNKGLTQEQFAPVVGLSRSYITEVETGKRNISFLNFARIIIALDVDESSLSLLIQELDEIKKLSEN